MTTAEHAAAEHDEHAHPTDAQYWKIGGYLALVTMLEVSTYWWPESMQSWTAILLLVMMVVKFSVVALYFMHLKFDAKILNRALIAGLLFAVAVYGATLGAMNIFESDSGSSHFNDAPRQQPQPPPPTDPTTPVRSTTGH